MQIATVHPPTSASRSQICADSWRAEQIKYAAINFAGSLCSVFPGKHRETMGIMGITSERGTGSTTLCNWFSKPESSEIAEHMELNRAALPSRGTYNPLLILQQIQPPPPDKLEGPKQTDSYQNKRISLWQHIVPRLCLWLVLLTGQPVSRTSSVGIKAGRTTLQCADKTALHTQVAPLPTSALPVDPVYRVWASGPLAPDLTSTEALRNVFIC